MATQVAPLEQAPADAPDGEGVLKWGRRAFLGAGLLPGAYAMRALPTGMWHMAWIWGLMLGGLAFVVSLAPMRQVRRPARRLMAILLAAAVITSVVWLAALAEARGADMPPAELFGWIAVLIQAAVAVVVIRRLARHEDQSRVLAIATGLGAVVVTAVVILLVDVDLPDWMAVVGIALSAARVSRLASRWRPGASTDSYAANCVLVLWATIVLVIETGLLGRPGGFPVAAMALAAGVVTLFVMARSITAPNVFFSLATVAAGLGMLSLAWVLVPSHASFRWIHGHQFATPATYVLAGERYDEGLKLERWYDTALDPAAAQLAAHDAFGGLVSEWANDESPYDIDGVVLGYQLNVRIWDMRTESIPRPPSSRLCTTEIGTCVLVELRRSDERGDGTKPLRLVANDP